MTKDLINIWWMFSLVLKCMLCYLKNLLVLQNCIQLSVKFRDS